jgi:glycosyltransferase involved in cell wall biosynthesis
LRVAVWGPLPPARSGIADHTAELLPALTRRLEVVAVVENVGAVDREVVGEVPVVQAPAPGARFSPEADLHLYQIGNSPAHVFAYRAACARPGVVVLHEWTLHDLVWREAAERGDVAAYLRAMRRSHGEEGSFVGRQVARGLGGSLLPSLFPANDRLLDASLAVVCLTRAATDKAARRRPGGLVLHMPQHIALPPGTPPSRGAARQALGLPTTASIVTAPGLATAAKGLRALVRATAALRARRPELRLVVAGEVEAGLPLASWARDAGLDEALRVTGRVPLSDLVGHLVAADVVAALRFPSHGEVSAVLLRALGVGRPALVTASTPAAEEFPEGMVIPVDPGAREEAEIEAFLELLVGRPGLAETIGRLARSYVQEHHALETVADRLAAFLLEVHARHAELAATVAAEQVGEGTLYGYLSEEIRRAARELGVGGLPLGLAPLLRPLMESRA